MLITEVEKIHEKDVENFAWSGLSHFVNQETNKQKIISIHGIKNKTDKNIIKQAAQIRQAVLLAKEYYKTSLQSTLATKPVLLYYSCMSLALAEILLKQDGNSSLDMARGQHAHHGLEFTTTLKKEQNLIDSGNKLCAKPMKSGDEYRGTFELWRKTATHLPLVGEKTLDFGAGASQTTNIPIFVNVDEPLEHINKSGFTLLECLKRLPFMMRILNMNDISVPFARASISQSAKEKNKTERVIKIIIHPMPKKIRKDLESKFIIHPSYINHMDFKDVGDGYIFNIKFSELTQELIFKFPNGININTEEVYLCSESMRLNEFGNLYVSLFILSNISRYYPDVWIYHIENHTPLSFIVEYFLKKASERMALLTLSELSRVYYIE